MSGSPRSSVMTSGFRLLAISTPSAPPLATVTSNPAWVSTVRTSSRISWSSSMTRPTRASLIEPPQCQRLKYSWLRISCLLWSCTPPQSRLPRHEHPHYLVLGAAAVFQAPLPRIPADGPGGVEPDAVIRDPHPSGPAGLGVLPSHHEEPPFRYVPHLAAGDHGA